MKPIPLQRFVQFRGKPFPWGWETALIDQNLRCIECKREFNPRAGGLKADFCHDKDRILRAVCPKCNDKLHGGFAFWPGYFKRRRLKREKEEKLNI